VSKIMAANRTSSQFKTLRDQFGVNEIMMSELKTLKVIGEGAFATVEKCLYTPSEWGGQQTKIVAVKKLKPEIVSNEPDLKSFMDEVALMRKLKHKNIVECE
jgi:serine/threonine protein kinase